MKGKMYSRRFLLEKTGIRTIVAVLILATFLVQVSAAPPTGPGEGEETFQQKCASCHTIGGGVLVGPDLQGVTAERDADWLAKWLAAPDKMLAEGDPIATDLLQEFNNIPMPNLGLGEQEIADLIAYMQTQDANAPAETETSAASQPEPEPVAVAPQGYPEFGSKLFIGELRFENGGPACVSCHSVDTMGGLGGGTLGPNLTHVYDRYGDAGLDAALTSLPFPTMQGVFSNKPLTPGEAADLKAFFAQTDLTTRHPVNATWFVIWGIVGAIAFMGIGHVIWMKRLDGVRKPLVGR